MITLFVHDRNVFVLYIYIYFEVLYMKRTFIHPQTTQCTHTVHNPCLRSKICNFSENEMTTERIMSRISFPMYDIGGEDTERMHRSLHDSILSYLECVLGSEQSSSLPAADRKFLEQAVQHNRETGYRKDEENSFPLWKNEDLFFSQGCGQEWYEVPEFQEHLEVLGAPVYTACQSCPPGFYQSAIITRKDIEGAIRMPADFSGGLLQPQHASLGGLVGMRLAINSWLSYSGFVGISNAVSIRCDNAEDKACESGCERKNIFLQPEVLVTGCHRQSVAAIRKGEADVASIDLTSWHIIQKLYPEETQGLVVIGHTDGCLAPPVLVLKKNLVAYPVAFRHLQDALVHVMSLGAESNACALSSRPILAPGLPLALSSLGIGGFVRTTSQDYRLFFSTKVMTDAPGFVSARHGMEARAQAWAVADYMERVDVSTPYYFPPPGLRSTESTSMEANLWISRGLALCFGFNHYAGVDCFMAALAAEPDCGLAHWGAAYALGENYNKKEVSEDDMKRSLEHATKAHAWAMRQPEQTPKCRDRLIAGTVLRRCCRGEQLNDEKLKKQMSLDYAVALQKVAAEFPNDPLVVCLYAEAIMNVSPWALWTEPAEPNVATITELVQLLEQGLETAPMHPGLCHLYVHTMEMCPKSQGGQRKALGAALLLRSQWPALGHLLHMPSHLDMQLGWFERAVVDNTRAIAADAMYETYRTNTSADNNCPTSMLGNGDVYLNCCYYFGYRLHNENFVLWSSIVSGDHAAAWATSQKMKELIPTRQLQLFPDFLETFMVSEWHVLVRFGLWHEILERPVPHNPDPNLVCTCVATAYYAKGIAAAALGKLDAAEEFRTAFRAAVKLVPETRVQHNVKAVDAFAIANAMLDGEMAYRYGNIDEAFVSLREAVRLEDALPYDEPPGWMVPTRHALGALLVEKAQHCVDPLRAESLFEEAEVVFRQDLETFPGNVWATSGLLSCLERHVTASRSCCASESTPNPNPDTTLASGSAALDERNRLQLALEDCLSAPYITPSLAQSLRCGRACLCAGMELVGSGNSGSGN